jgi:hypothetical protein
VIGRLVAHSPGGWRGCARQGGFLERQVGVQVSLGGLGPGVAEPQRDRPPDTARSGYPLREVTRT